MAHIPSPPTMLEDRPGIDRLLQPPPRRIRFSLRAQIVLATVVIMALVAVLYAILRREVLTGFDHLQSEFIERDTQRVVNALHSELEALDQLALEWASSHEVASATQAASSVVLDRLS